MHSVLLTVYYESVTKINSQMKNLGDIWRSLNAGTPASSFGSIPPS